MFAQRTRAFIRCFIAFIRRGISSAHLPTFRGIKKRVCDLKRVREDCDIWLDEGCYECTHYVSKRF
jgi:hypothetical protein